MNKHSPTQPRYVLGVPMTVQAAMLVLSAVAVASLIGLAVLSWLEHYG